MLSGRRAPLEIQISICALPMTIGRRDVVIIALESSAALYCDERGCMVMCFGFGVLFDFGFGGVFLFLDLSVDRFFLCVVSKILLIFNHQSSFYAIIR